MDAIILLNTGTIQKVVVTGGGAYAATNAIASILHAHGLELGMDAEDAEDTDTYYNELLVQAENVMGPPWHLKWIEDVTTIR